MDLIPPTRTTTRLAFGNATAFLFSFVWVMVGLSTPTKSPAAIVTMTMGCLVFGWLFVATVIAHITSERGILCERPSVAGEAHALTRFPIVVRLENPSNRWPLLFLTAELVTASDGNLLHSPLKFIGLLPVRTAGQFEWQITSRKRGHCQIHGLEAATSFPGSLLVRKFFFAFDLSLLTLPAVYTLKPNISLLLQGQRQAVSHQPSSPSAMEEFVGIREYRPGDNPRNVSLAHSIRMPEFPLQLVVREYSDPLDNEVCIVLDTAAPSDESDDSILMRYRFEKSISFAVALCRQLCEQKHPVRFIARQADGKSIELQLKHASRDIPLLERRLARIVPIHDRGIAGQVLQRQARMSDAILLFITLSNEAERPGQRLGSALRITPEWQASFVAGVHTA